MNGYAFIKYVQPTDVIRVPSYIARCPECGDDLEVEIIEYTSDDNRVTIEGFIVECDAGTDDQVTPHNYEQHMWERIYDRVHEWLYEGVRVIEEGTQP